MNFKLEIYSVIHFQTVNIYLLEFLFTWKLNFGAVVFAIPVRRRCKVSGYFCEQLEVAVMDTVLIVNRRVSKVCQATLVQF